VHLEVAAIQEQVVEPYRAEIAVPPGLELLTDPLADAADRRLRQRRLRPEDLGQGGSMSRSDRPRTQPEMTSDSSALVRVTPAPNSREQNAWSVPRSLGRCSSTGPIVVATAAGGCQPLREPGRPWSVRRW
jgi:hypothetical protein